MNNIKSAKPAHAAAEEYNNGVSKAAIARAIMERIPAITLDEAWLMVEAIDAYVDKYVSGEEDGK